jgi:hopanoid biosynthesis associated protein HpnK
MLRTLPTGARAVRALIVTADDFGAAREVNDAVEHGHRHGILSAASLMVGAEAASDAVARARRMPGLRVGLHLVLAEGRPILPPSSLPDLVDRTGHFRSDMVRAGATIFFKSAARQQLAAEITAQFEAFRATGLALDHVNAHKHFHLHPTIAATIIEVGKTYGMRAVRLPLEPRAVLDAVDAGTAPAAASVFRAWVRWSRARFRRAGVRMPDQVFGVAWSGAMAPSRVRGLITHLPNGLSEIYLHPATAGGFTGAAPGYRYEEELAALTDESVASAVSHRGVRLGGFADFEGSA